ncbi:Lrp/AsnC ligand binding domain-containing protein [Nocardioides sp. NPDC051685]|uniref:Lrp/AsnC ligand binding domain-containing protein n=1 Tax=Nocardioides sp. NPDC051685 TaxID=3364334 RepID=UPI0037B3213E
MAVLPPDAAGRSAAARARPAPYSRSRAGPDASPSRANIEAFRDWVGALPEAVGVFVTSGRMDFIVHVAVADNDALYAFVIDRLTSRAEIADVETSVIYEHLRTMTVEP